jgi:hypothetical protein
MTGPGIRGLTPGPGDEVMVGRDLLPAIDHPRWFRATIVEQMPAGALRLHGWFLARPDLGEVGVSHPFSFVVHRPAQLVVRRGGGPAGAEPPAGRLPGIVEQLLGPPTPTDLPPAALAALEHPDRPR